MRSTARTVGPFNEEISHRTLAYAIADRAPTARMAWACLRLTCTVQRDGCPKIVNLGSARTDLFYERKKYGFKKR